MIRLALAAVLLAALPILPTAYGEGPNADGDKAEEGVQRDGLEVLVKSTEVAMLGESPFLALSCEVRNPTSEPLIFVGYLPDSFDPPLAEGTASPIFVLEFQRNGEWQPHPLGWCGTGMGAIELAAEGASTFGAFVPFEPAWDAVRVGIRWSRPLDFDTAEAEAYTTAWSKPLPRTEVAQPAE